MQKLFPPFEIWGQATQSPNYDNAEQVRSLMNSGMARVPIGGGGGNGDISLVSWIALFHISVPFRKTISKGHRITRLIKQSAAHHGRPPAPAPLPSPYIGILLRKAARQRLPSVVSLRKCLTGIWGERHQRKPARPSGGSLELEEPGNMVRPVVDDAGSGNELLGGPLS